MSERGRKAKTHRGTWSLFSEEFIAAGQFDADLGREARATQEPREGVDYAAVRVSSAEAKRIAEVARRFVDAVDALIGK